MCTSRFGASEPTRTHHMYVCMARFGSFPNRAIHTDIGRPIWPANTAIGSASLALPITALASRIGRMLVEFFPRA